MSKSFIALSDDDLKGITSNTLLMTADQDVRKPEHEVKISRLIANSRLVILPDVNVTIIRLKH